MQCKIIEIILRLESQKIGLRAHLFKFQILHQSLQTAHRLPWCFFLQISKLCRTWNSRLAECLFLQKLAGIPSYKHNAISIIFYTWDRARAIHDAHTIKFNWHYPNFGGLTFKLFCLLNQKNGLILKFRLPIGYKFFPKAVSNPQYLSFPVEIRTIV